MSAKKSWDIQPKAKKTPLRILPQRVEAPRPRTAPPVPVRRTASSRAAAPAQPLRQRRRQARQRVLIFLGTLAVIAIGAGFYGIWQPAFRVQHVKASGTDATGIPQVATTALTGTYLHIVPRDSIFFLPQESIRAAVLAAYPDINAVSISRTSLDTISITAIGRVPAFTWCGESIDAPIPDGSCYSADSTGFLFAPVATSTLPVYVPLVASSTSQLGASVAEPGGVMGVMQLDRALASLGARVVAIQVRGDEADLFTVGGTRITYVIGQEAAAASLAAASFPTLDLNSGSIDYIDLRFTGKVYYKKK